MAKQLGEITGADVNACLAALRTTGGNIDLAAASLMGF
jgi:translation elongation factor EF-Ts